MRTHFSALRNRWGKISASHLSKIYEQRKATNCTTWKSEIGIWGVPSPAQSCSPAPIAGLAAPSPELACRTPRDSPGTGWELDCRLGSGGVRDRESIWGDALLEVELKETGHRATARVVGHAKAISYVPL